MQSHGANPATFIPTQAIAPKQLMPNTSQAYIHQFTRTQIQAGQLYARTHMDHHRNSHREVAVHGTLKQNLANSQVTIDHAHQTVKNTKVTAQTYLASTQTKTVKRGMTSIQAGSVNERGSP